MTAQQAAAGPGIPHYPLVIDGQRTESGYRGHRVAHALRAGTIWINAYRVVGPDVPFGGMGRSGIGRENGIDAVREYTQTKAIWVELTGGTRDPFTLG